MSAWSSWSKKEKSADGVFLILIQVLLAFVLHHENVIAIPRSGKAEHVLENCQAAEIKLTEEEYRLLDRAFLAPDHKVWLDIV